MNLTILVTLFLWLQYGVIMANIGKELEESLEKAMKCKHRDPPAEPVLAMTPYRFSQLLAVMRYNSRAASCGRPQIDAPFNLEDIRTWPFCIFGTCQWDQCVCLPAYSGPNCATFTKKCWLMYCFLTSCHPVSQGIYCKCDPRFYGRTVISGEYWYNGVKRNEFIPPPPHWHDDESLASLAGINTAILNVPDANGPPVNRHIHGQERSRNRPRTGYEDGQGSSGGREHPRDRPQTGHEYEQASPGGEHLRNRPQTVGIRAGQPDQNTGTSGKEFQKPHSISGSDAKEVQEETSEDLKEALAEIEDEKPSASVTLTPGWAVFLFATFNIYLSF